ncbi:hypothetical protein MJO52_04230 [Microbulbifer variabilis]|uniref:Spore coat protein U domain-containing protein n=1 Tax=Microbulbifer variabilis TaxID=266805 RepID=A0ABY4VDH4_9GAMM|nr:hypothetical protein [Microbulbifer variabilis]USD22346.1 hypothetical protein MJO52_04230 [Microbulbifer variabilis]
MKVQPTVKSHRLLKQMTPNKKSRKFIKNFLILIFLLYLPNSSLASCQGDTYLRICNLSGWHTINNQAQQQNISFTFLSQELGAASPFSLEIQPEHEGYYRLYADNGDTVDLSLALSAPHRKYFTFRPGKTYQDIPGSISDFNADLKVKLVGNRNFTSSSYRGNFQLQAIQEESGKAEEINFSIELTIEPTIKILQLDNIFLSDTGISPGQDIVGHEDFCVVGNGFSHYAISLSSSSGIIAGNSGRITTSLQEEMFMLTGIREELPYMASFSNNAQGRALTNLNASGHIPGIYARTTPEGCLGDNTRITIRVPSPYWERATESKYTDVLTVTVTSQ